jgi:hypothetical protein
MNTLVAVLAMWMQFFPFPGPGRAPVAGGGGGAIADTFSRPDDATGWGGNWTTLGGSPVVSSGTGMASAVPASAVWSPGSFTADQFSEATFIAFNSAYSAPIVRASASGYYSCLTDTGGLYAAIYTPGSGTQVFSSTYLPYTALGRGARAGDVLRVEVTGTAPPTVNCFVNGTSYMAVQHWGAGALTSGRPGLLLNHTSDAWDNWSGGNIP